MADITLFRPWWLILLLLPLIFVYYDFAKHYKLQNFIREDIINYLMPKKRKKISFEELLKDQEETEEKDENSSKNTISNEEKEELIAKPKLWKKYGWLLVPYVLCVIALTGPAVQNETRLWQSDENWVWVVDSSASMLATDLQPNRFQRARYSLIELLNASNTHRKIGLLAYTSDSYVISPPTDDRSTLLFFLQELQPEIMPTYGSEPLQALEKAVSILDKDDENPGNILLVLDDIKDQVQAEELITFINNCKYPIYIYAIGTNMGSPIQINNQHIKDKEGKTVMAKTNLELIQKVAKATKSKVYYEFDENNTPNLISMYNYEHPKYKITERSKHIYVDKGYYFAYAGILCLLCFIRNYFFSFLLIGMFTFGATSLDNRAMAADNKEAVTSNTQNANLVDHPNVETINFTDEEIKLYPNEYGYYLFTKGQYQEALKHLTDPRWRGNAYYRLKRYDKAIQEYQILGNDADAKYNIGNCFALMQTPNSLNDAILAYDQAIEIAGEHKDAHFNKNVIIEFLRKIREQEMANAQAAKSEENSILGISMSSVFAPEEKGNLLQRRLLLQQKKRKIPTPEQTW